MKDCTDVIKYFRSMLAGEGFCAADRDDFVQESFLRILVAKYVSDGQALTDLRPRLRKVMRSTIIDHYRKNSRFSPLPSAELWPEPQHAGREEMFKWLAAAAGELSPLDYRIVELYRSGHSSTQVAEYLGMPDRTVRYRFKKACKQLREKWRQEQINDSARDHSGR